MMELKYQICNKITNLKNEPLLGGWVSTLNNEIKISADGTHTLKMVSLSETTRRTKVHNWYVSSKRDVSAVKNEIVH